MVKSMTGFGRGEAQDEFRKITIEMKSVNHRYLDLNIKIPKSLNPFETEIRNYLKSRIVRGKVDVYVTLETAADQEYVLKYNSKLAEMYVENIKAMADEFGLDYDLKATHLSRYPDVLEMEEAEADESELKALLFEALEKAANQFGENRTKEGERLQKDLLDKMDEMSGYVSVLEKRSPEIIEEYTSRLKAKVNDLLEAGHIDENRIAAEIVLYADKVCIDEEMVRLRSHIEETKQVLLNDKEVGRKLDFIAQEMNRESNTILSKSTDVEIAGIGISLKTLIEKVREQIQNLE
ncbi:MAG: YicC family protein [Lachnospiraceae bacterium]|nr:YicC family protein [Lachnospiraceae bacterium]MDD6192434.1 YicC family protein [Lachnospiraceae bacterium]MDY4794181.1 YicC/YloC family endoribonuclease [Pararoseburia sp.]